MRDLCFDTSDSSPSRYIDYGIQTVQRFWDSLVYASFVRKSSHSDLQKDALTTLLSIP